MMISEMLIIFLSHKERINLPEVKDILLLSDTHSCTEPDISAHFQNADEIWHAGDWGDEKLSDLMEKTGKTVRGVYGNIDGQKIRLRYPETLIFECEGLKVFIKHIGGHPGKYASGVREEIRQSGAGLFICGHSHILRVVRDPKLGILYMNPGAAGRHGFHIMRTMLRFRIYNGEIKNAAVIELGKRTAGILPINNKDVK